MTRYRVETTPTGLGTSIHTISGVTSKVTQILPMALHRTITDEVVPNYRKRSTAGEIFNNPYNSSRVTFDVNDNYAASGHIINIHTGAISNVESGVMSNYLLYNRFGNAVFPTVSFPDDGVAQATLQALASVNKTEFDANLFAAEWSKTKRIHRDLGNALVRIAKTNRVVKKGSFKKIPLYDTYGNPVLNRKGKPVYRYLHSKAEDVRGGYSAKAGDFSNAYLLGRFGVGPLLNDLEGAVKFLLSGKRLRQTARGFTNQQASATSSRTVGDAGGTSHTVVLRTVRTLETRIGLLYETDPFSRAAAQLGLTRPLSTLWEATPWSFVIDRFVQIGTWLDAIQPAGFVKPLATWVSTTETIVHSAEVASAVSVDKPHYKFNADWNGGFVKVSRFKSRRPIVLAVPRQPTISGDVKSMHVADYVALTLQRLKRV